MKSWSSAATTDTMASFGMGASATSPRCSTPGMYHAESFAKAMTFYQDVCRHIAVMSAVEEVKSHAKKLINQLQGTVTRWITVDWKNQNRKWAINSKNPFSAFFDVLNLIVIPGGRSSGLCGNLIRTGWSKRFYPRIQPLLITKQGSICTIPWLKKLGVNLIACLSVASG